jgi:DNA-binding NarL/FixJ family response regulator
MKTKILIVDDHPLIAKGIKKLLDAQTKFRVVGIINNLDGLRDDLLQSCDLLILDLNVNGKNSIKVIDEIKSINPNLKILIYSSYNKPSLVRKALKKGIDGYVLKDTDEEEFIHSLNVILLGEQFIGSTVAFRKDKISKKLDEFEDVFAKKGKLSKREQEVMQLIVDGFDNQMIAEKLFISKHTVQSHRKSIFNKMEVHSAAELIKLLHGI